MKIKYLDKRGWRRVIESRYYEKIIYLDDEKIMVGLLDIKKVRAPLFVPIVDKEVKVADNNYKWLQIMSEQRSYSLTVMYDEHWNVLQYYFDVNTHHYLEPGEARRKDIYLDVLALPDGRCELVDESDIKRALKKNKITEEMKDEAYRTAEHVMDRLNKDFDQFERLAEECLTEIKDSLD